MTFIKPDPVLMEEQDDLLLSYLNSDYLSNDSSWPLDDTSPSTPESTTSSSAQPLSPSSSPSSSKDFFEQDPHQVPPHVLHWPMQPYFFPTGTSLQPDLLQSFPFVMPCVDGASSALPSAAQPIYMANVPPTTPPSLYSDSEQTKKRRGRKKRDSSASVSTLASTNTTATNTTTTTNAAATTTNNTTIAPAPPVGLKSLAPLRPIAATVAAATPPVIETPIIKAEPIQIKATSSPKVDKIEVVDQKAAAIAKRQERLIKNRAAALLSRKRKREHLTALEEQKDSLTAENTHLTSRVQDLESENQQLLNENQQLKNKLALYESVKEKPLLIEKTTKSKVSQSGMVLMIILFSFAILALPTAKNNKLPLMSSHTNVNNPTFQLNRYCDQNEDEIMEEKEETFFIKSVSGNELENIITTKDESIKEEESSNPIRLYSDQFVQLQQQEDNTDSGVGKSFSFLCPYEKATDDKRLLQIDMQVVGSRIVQGVFNMIKPKTSKLLETRSQMSKRMRRRLAKARVKQRLIKRLA